MVLRDHLRNSAPIVARHFAQTVALIGKIKSEESDPLVAGLGDWLLLLVDEGPSIEPEANDG